MIQHFFGNIFFDMTFKLKNTTKKNPNKNFKKCVDEFRLWPGYIIQWLCRAQILLVLAI